MIFYRASGDFEGAREQRMGLFTTKRIHNFKWKSPSSCGRFRTYFDTPTTTLCFPVAFRDMKLPWD